MKRSTDLGVLSVLAVVLALTLASGCEETGQSGMLDPASDAEAAFATPTASTQDGSWGRGGGRGQGGERFERGSGRGGQGGSQGPDREFLAELDLTSDQEAQMKELFESHREEMKELHEAIRSGDISEEEFQSAMEEARASMLDVMGGILTEEQFAIAQQHHEDRAIERAERRLEALEEGDTDRRLQCMTELLDLDETQQAQIEEILESSLQGEAAILQGMVSGEVDAEDGHVQLRSIRASVREQIDQVLTDEQKELLEEARSERGGGGGKPGLCDGDRRSDGPPDQRGGRRGGEGRGKRGSRIGGGW